MIGTASDYAVRAENSPFLADVVEDLQKRPKQLRSKYFYDALGSQLFEAICELPWYTITRTEQNMLDRLGPEIGAAMPQLSTVAELGCGAGIKLALLIERIRSVRRVPLSVRLIDISPAALDLSERRIRELADIALVSHCAPYSKGLELLSARRPPHGAMLLVFLGSNIGNFDPTAADEFFREIRAILRPGDGFLLGADLVKTERELLLAYGDPIGVTAAFNKNLLARINRELDGDFDLDRFEHTPRWNAAASRVESYLVSLRAQSVHIGAANLTVEFAAGEPIWTECSHKYTEAGLREMGARAGFACHRQWVDPTGFALTLYT